MALVLRFSDFQADTYKEHEQIVASAGYVWWGWWKKLHEPFPAVSLQSLRRALRSGPVEIGLVNRTSHTYLAASCTHVQTSNGSSLKSPEPSITPAYYRTASFPLWLRIERFGRLSETDWSQKFGMVPIGDDTYFDDDPGTVLVLDQGTGKREGRGLLHLSDLHFGVDYAFKPNEEVRNMIPLEKRIASALPCKPAGVVVSGDLTTQGDNDGLVSARLFLERLSQELDLSRDRFVIAPGNHDIVVNDLSVTRDFENEQHFRTQMTEFYGFRSALERVHEFQGSDGITYVLVVLNSSRPRDKRTMNYGYVGRDRSEPNLVRAAELRDAAEGDTWLGLVLHHHVLPGQQIEYAIPDRPVSIAIDAGELVGMATDLGFDAILHGHEHVPFVGKTSRIAEFGGYERQQIGRDREVTVLASGSTSVRVERLTDEMRHNTFSFYRVSSDAIHVQLYELTSKIGPRVAAGWDFHVRRDTRE